MEILDIAPVTGEEEPVENEGSVEMDTAVSEETVTGDDVTGDDLLPADTADDSNEPIVPAVSDVLILTCQFKRS